MKKTLLILTLIALAFLLGGCGASKKLVDLETKTAANTTQLAELKGRVDGYPALFSANAVQIAEVKKGLDGVGPLISGNTTRITDLERQISSYPSMIASNASGIAALEKRVADYPGLIDENARDIVALRREIADYSTQIAGNAAQLAELKRQVDSQASMAINNTALIATSSAQLSQVQRQVETYAAVVEAQRAKVAALEAQFATLAAASEAGATQAAKLQTQVDSHSVLLEVSRSETAALYQKVQTDSAQLEASRLEIASLRDVVQTYPETMASNRERLAALEARIAQIEAQGAGAMSSLRIAYLDPDRVLGLFATPVADLLQTQGTKQAELVRLEGQRSSGAVSEADYAAKAKELQVGVLQARADVCLGRIKAWRASAGFADDQADLEGIENAAQGVADGLRELGSSLASAGGASQFETTKAALEAVLGSLEAHLREVMRAKVLGVADKVASEGGFDLVLRSEDVLVNGNRERLADITDLVETKLASLLK